MILDYVQQKLISYRTKNKKFDKFNVYLPKDVSAIAVSEKSKINRPKDLDKYASYGARYEDLIIKQLIINDGGKGEIRLSKKIGCLGYRFKKQI